MQARVGSSCMWASLTGLSRLGPPMSVGLFLFLVGVTDEGEPKATGDALKASALAPQALAWPCFKDPASAFA